MAPRDPPEYPVSLPSMHPPLPRQKLRRYPIGQIGHVTLLLAKTCGGHVAALRGPVVKSMTLVSKGEGGTDGRVDKINTAQYSGPFPGHLA